jgi:hypothetical protein
VIPPRRFGDADAADAHASATAASARTLIARSIDRGCTDFERHL